KQITDDFVLSTGSATISRSGRFISRPKRGVSDSSGDECPQGLPVTGVSDKRFVSGIGKRTGNECDNEHRVRLPPPPSSTPPRVRRRAGPWTHPCQAPR